MDKTTIFLIQRFIQLYAKYYKFPTFFHARESGMSVSYKKKKKKKISFPGFKKSKYFNFRDIFLLTVLNSDQSML